MRSAYVGAYTGDQIRAAEAGLIQDGFGPELMSRASHALFSHIHQLASTLEPNGLIVGLIGKGNNGGDGLYALAEAARSQLPVAAIALFDELHPQALADYLSTDAPVYYLSQHELPDLLQLCHESVLLLDAVLGTGARAGLAGRAGEFVSALLHSQDTLGPVLACDTPSGVDASTGEVAEPVLSCALTITFGAPKLGLLVDPGAEKAGEVLSADIGLEFNEAPAALVFQEKDLAPFIAAPSRNATKYSTGLLEVLAGSQRYPGAGQLCVGAAVNTGVGMVCFVGPDQLSRELVQTHPEVVLGPATRTPNARVIGPGIAVEEPGERERVLPALAQGGALVLDASSITLLDQLPPAERRNCVITPHAGELAALFSHLGQLGLHEQEITAGDISASPVLYASKAAELTGAQVLLKGHISIVASPEGELFIVHANTSTLATAGTGDVLAGMIGALLATNPEKPVAETAAAAACLHARAARVASDNNQHRISASMLLDHIYPPSPSPSTRPEYQPDESAKYRQHSEPDFPRIARL